MNRITEMGGAKSVTNGFTEMRYPTLRNVADIERFIGRRIEQTVLEGFAYDKSVLFNEAGKPRPTKKVMGLFNRSGRTFRPRRR